ncbi:MAG: transcription antitermination factor NusB [Pseudomonadota bacterium]
MTKAAATHSTGSKKARASATRLAAVQAAYQLLTTDKVMEDIIPEFLAHHASMELDGETLLPPDADMFTRTLRTVENRRGQLQELIDAQMPAQSGEEGSRKVDDLMQATLLCGTAELLTDTDTDGPIIIADYIAVIMAFYGGSEHRLVNAVLDKIYKAVRI